MFDRIVDFSIRWRIAILVITGAVFVAGYMAVRALPIDAVPDVTNVQVLVLTESPGLSVEEVERYITFPIETGLNGLPDLAEIRSITRMGLSAITVVFRDHVNIWFARQLVMERLRDIEADIPEQFGRPQLAPVSTGLGEIYRFTMQSDQHTGMQLRTMLNWEIIPRLRGVPGVIEVNALGGGMQQYEVVLDPDRLASFRLTLGQVLHALERNNANVGGGYIERGAERFTIRGEGQLRNEEDIRRVVVATDSDGTPVTIRRLGQVRIGTALPFGAATANGRGEVVSATVMMLIGQNSRDVVRAVQERIAEIRRDLPRGVRIETYYDRASFINRTLRTVGKNLAEGAFLVGLVLLVFLGSLRGSLIVTLGIPFSMIIAIAGMLYSRVSGNLMSLGAIDFGLLVDGPIVMLEAVIAQLAIAEVNARNRIKIIGGAIRRAARPVVFSVGIILLVYLPLLTLEGVEGKMFRPMAITMAFALFGSVVFSLFVFPAAAATFLPLPKKSGHHGGIFGAIEKQYRRVVSWAIRRRKLVLGAALSAFVASVPIATSLGADFLPRIFEGDFVIVLKRLPSVALTEARRLDLEAERVLLRFPEVESVIGLGGRAEVAVDPVGIDSTDMIVRLRPPETWRTTHDPEDLAARLKSAIESNVPSTFASVSQPIEDRTNDMISGSRADVAISLYGEDLQTMVDLSRRIRAIVSSVSGAGDVRVERLLGAPMIQVRADRSRLSRYGISVDDVLAAVECTRIGRRVGVIFEGSRRFDLRVMLPPDDRSGEAFGRLPIGATEGQVVPLAQLANIAEEEGPSQISREGLRRRARVEVNVRGRDLVSFVSEARARVEREVPLPPGYRVTWGGQFENFERASGRLAVVVPLALAIIFTMLFFAFGNFRYALAVFSAVPFALIGGVVALKARAMTFSIPAAVGFIALCGIAVLNGVVMASEAKRLLEGGTSRDEAILGAAVSVLRALVLTASVAALGFMPMAISTSAGSEVQRPLASVVIGGLVSSSLLGAITLPVMLRFFMPETFRPSNPGDDSDEGT